MKSSSAAQRNERRECECMFSADREEDEEKRVDDVMMSDDGADVK